MALGCQFCNVVIKKERNGKMGFLSGHEGGNRERGFKKGRHEIVHPDGCLNMINRFIRGIFDGYDPERLLMIKRVERRKDLFCLNPGKL
jgi:hypothetical protein